MLSFKLKLYEDCFDSKNAEIFFTHENKNHVINLKFDKKSSYDSFYTLSKKKVLNFTKLFIKKSCVELHSRILQFH